VAVDQHDLGEDVARLARGRRLVREAEADQVLGERRLAGDARAALLGERRREAVGAQAVDNGRGRDVGQGCSML
jgi:hypothetical protein